MIIATARSEIAKQLEFGTCTVGPRGTEVSDGTIAAIANVRPRSGLEGDEALLVNYVHELLRPREGQRRDWFRSAMTSRFGDDIHCRFNTCYAATYQTGGTKPVDGVRRGVGGGND